jgi:hypothetical protein
MIYAILAATASGVGAFVFHSAGRRYERLMISRERETLIALASVTNPCEACNSPECALARYVREHIHA